MFKTVAVDLQKGQDNEIVLEYYQGGGGAAIRLGYELSNTNKNDAIESAVALAGKSDLVVLCVGFDYKTESEGFDRPFNLPEEQEALINLILKANKNVIVLLSSGGNVEMQAWLPQTKALLHTWYPGQEGAVAVAEILFGDVNPSGKLPVSFEKRWEDNATFKSYFDDDKDKRVNYSEGIFVGYRHFDKNNIEPQFPFGFGLSYTTFSYQNLKLSNEQINAEDDLTVTFTVKNDGTSDGAEISQLYVRDIESSIPRPVKELKGFNKTFLKAGEEKEITMKIVKDAFSFYDVATKKWIVEPGNFEILIGSSSRDIRLKGQVQVIK
jgi:beta-glucosidase